MNKLIIFCENYVQINYALQLATRNCGNRPVTLVIPGFPDLLTFFQVINEKVFHNSINIIYVEPYQPGRAKARGINKICHVIPDIVKERRYLKEAFCKYFAGMEGDEVFFFNLGFYGLKIYLLKKLSKRNRLVYLNSKNAPQMKAAVPANIVELANLMMWKLIYGGDTVVGSLPYYRGFLYVSDRFIRREVDRVFDSSEIDEMMLGFDLSTFRVFDTGEYDVIYFDDDLIGTDYISDSTIFKRELAGVFDILGKYFPEEKIACKYHPGYTGDKTLIKAGDMLPSFIPAELLYHEKTRLYLGIFSLSIANVEKGLAVSLANLITFKRDEIRENLAAELVKRSKTKILFPESLSEFERIISEVKEHKEE